MRVLCTDPSSNGKVILNPLKLREILLNADRGGATGVITERDLAISTIPCTSHHDTAKDAGIEINDVTYGEAFGFSSRTMRLAMAHDGITVEIWCCHFWNELKSPENYALCPFTEDQLRDIYDWLKRHPKLNLAYSWDIPEIEINLMDDMAQAVRIFDRDGLRTPDDITLPLGAEKAMAGM